VVLRRPPEVAAHRPAEVAAGVDEATLTTIERKLAQHVGPLAHHLVQNAARRSGSLDELCDTLGQLIDRPEQRAQFRQEILADQTQPPAARRAAVAADEARRAEQELVRFVGPIARILVKRAAAGAASVDELWSLLATHIPGEADRQAFLRRRG
jgi:serine/threonine-protein kinase